MRHEVGLDKAGLGVFPVVEGADRHLAVDRRTQANALLRELLGEVRVWGDPEARDRVAIEIRGEASRVYQPPEAQQKSAPWGASLSAMQISVVAGVGFEPTTFRL